MVYHPLMGPPPQPHEPLATSLCDHHEPASAWQAFSQEQRPLMSGPFARGEKEKVLSRQWRSLSKPEKASYKVSGIERRAPSPYNVFCKARRPLLPPGLRNAEREAALGQLWAALPGAGKAKWEALSKAAIVPATTRPDSDTSASPAPLQPAAVYLVPASVTTPAAIAAPLLATTVSFASMPEMVLTGAVELMTAEEALEVMLNY